MAILVKIGWEHSGLTTRDEARITGAIYRWQEHQAPFSFISAKTDIIMTDLNPQTKQFQALLHILKVNKVAFQAVGNINIEALHAACVEQTAQHQHT